MITTDNLDRSYSSDNQVNNKTVPLKDAILNFEGPAIFNDSFRAVSAEEELSRLIDFKARLGDDNTADAFIGPTSLPPPTSLTGKGSFTPQPKADFDFGLPERTVLSNLEIFNNDTERKFKAIVAQELGNKPEPEDKANYLAFVQTLSPAGVASYVSSYVGSLPEVYESGTDILSDAATFAIDKGTKALTFAGDQAKSAGNFVGNLISGFSSTVQLVLLGVIVVGTAVLIKNIKE